MNKVSKAKLLKLADRCEEALKDKSRCSMDLWRGEMWAIIAAVHELRKLKKLEPKNADARQSDRDSGLVITSARSLSR